MHPIDRGARIALRFLPDSKRVFADGWGPPELLDLLDVTGAGPPPTFDVLWERSWEERGLRLRHGRFDSPVAGLPDAAADAFVSSIEPAAGTHRWCVLLPAWNDEGYATRRKFAQRLNAAGIGALMLEAAMYGQRRPFHGGTPIKTVADFALMTRTIVEEGRGLVDWLHRGGSEAGVAGYSMGGSLAATVGATIPYPIALAPLAAAHAPASVFCTGVIAESVAWGALGPDGRTQLAEHLMRPSVLRVAPTPATKTAVLLGARGDGFVPPEATEAIHQHWPGAEMRWVRRGHASLLWWGLDQLVDAIVRSFERVYGSPADPGIGAAPRHAGRTPGADPAPDRRSP
jgi:dienelactone hydrolase